MFFGKKEDEPWSVSRESSPGFYTAQILDEWIGGLTEGVLLDLAAGQGIESQYMSKKHGRRVLAYDTSNTMRGNSIYRVENSDIFKIKYSQNSYAGALIKDAWVFFDPYSRVALLKQLYLGIKYGGSVLIMSQWSDTRAHVIPSSTSYPQRYLLSDYANTQDWLQAIQNEKKTGGKVIAVEYAVDENTFRDEASKSGFGVDEIKYFDMNKGLSLENRWKQTQQFVAILRK